MERRFGQLSFKTDYLIKIITKTQQKLSEPELLSGQIAQDRSWKVGLAASTYVLINLCKSPPSFTQYIIIWLWSYDDLIITTESTHYQGCRNKSIKLMIKIVGNEYHYGVFVLQK